MSMSRKSIREEQQPSPRRTGTSVESVSSDSERRSKEVGTTDSHNNSIGLIDSSNLSKNCKASATCLHFIGPVDVSSEEENDKGNTTAPEEVQAATNSRSHEVGQSSRASISRTFSEPTPPEFSRRTYEEVMFESGPGPTLAKLTDKKQIYYKKYEKVQKLQAKTHFTDQDYQECYCFWMEKLERPALTTNGRGGRFKKQTSLDNSFKNITNKEKEKIKKDIEQNHCQGGNEGCSKNFEIFKHFHLVNIYLKPDLIDHDLLRHCAPLGAIRGQACQNPNDIETVDLTLDDD